MKLGIFELLKNKRQSYLEKKLEKYPELRNSCDESNGGRYDGCDLCKKCHAKLIFNKINKYENILYDNFPESKYTIEHKNFISSLNPDIPF